MQEVMTANRLWKTGCENGKLLLANYVLNVKIKGAYIKMRFIIVITIIISFMQGIRTYIPETNHVSRVYSVTAILHILLMVHIALSAILNSFVLLH
jgi:hypothetical protein